MASLQSRMADFITALGTDIKSLYTKVGTLTSLTTTDKTSLVNAINEVKAGSSGAPPDASETVKGIAEIATQTETNTGTDDARIVTPLKLATLLGASWQPLDSDLTSIAALTTTSYGRALLTLANQAALTAALANGTETLPGILEIATQTETNTGTDDVRAITPLKFQTRMALYAQPLNTNLTSLTAFTTDTDAALAANSNTKLATQAAVKAYVDGVLDANNAMQFKGVIDCSANPNYPAASAGWMYKVSVAGKIGGASGTVVEVGDSVYCITDSTSSGNQATVGANWVVVQTNIDGAVTGPASSTTANIVTFNGTTGKVVQDSGVAVSTDGTMASNVDTKLPTEKAIRTYLVSNYQPLDSDLTNIAAVSTTSYGRALLALANQAALMALLSAPTETASGIIEIATQTEVGTGTDDVRAVTPLKLATNNYDKTALGDPNTDLASAYATAKA